MSAPSSILLIHMSVFLIYVRHRRAHLGKNIHCLQEKVGLSFIILHILTHFVHHTLSVTCLSTFISSQNNNVFLQMNQLNQLNVLNEIKYPCVWLDE